MSKLHRSFSPKIGYTGYFKGELITQIFHCVSHEEVDSTWCPKGMIQVKRREELEFLGCLFLLRLLRQFHPTLLKPYPPYVFQIDLVKTSNVDEC